MKKFKFSIIIANFNGEKYLPDCLSSLFKTDYPSYEVIIIEDGSSDKSLEIIESYKKKFDLILLKNDKNLGLVKSRNKAAKKASGEIIVFLDNDTEVNKNWLNGLSEIFSSDNKIGAAQCKIFDFNKQDRIQQIGMKLVPYTGFGVTLGRGEKDKGQFEDPIEIISLGAALAVRKEVLNVVGGFDKNLFHYTDDLDFSWRIWIAGYKIVLAPNAKIYHHIKIHNPNYKLYFHLSKNSIRMILKNYENSNILKYMPFALIFNVMGGLLVLFKKGSISALIGIIMGFAWSILFLPETLKERSRVQSSRRVEDKDLFDKIMISTNIFYIYKLYFKTAETTISLMKKN